MIFKIDNKILDTETNPVGLVFKTKEEAKILSEILSGIINGDTQYPVDNNGNWWFMCPHNMNSDDRDKWSILSSEQKELLEKTPEITLKLENQF